ncbi:MAG: HU family DNA-binding protein [Paludibacteraceae bacterium]|nr:HU family DNA-binding protein [Paludibacteraceae bacterium]
MEAKITWAELRKAVAKQLGAKEEEINRFMQAYSAAMEQALQTDKQFKITNLGTFKVQDVAARKSINVATGETFTIPSYNKLTFTSESAVKELVATATTTPVVASNSPLEKLNEQATEIVDILADLGQSPKEEKVESQKEKVESQKEKVEKEEKRRRPWLIAGLIILFIVILLSLTWLFYGRQLMNWYGRITQSEVIEEASMAQTDIMEIENEVVEEEVVTSSLPYPYQYKQFIATERLPRGSRLAWLARKYYNERDMWVFIFEANRDHIEHPSQILIGTPVRIPMLPQELRDLSNPETRQLVDRLIEEYKAL